MCTKRLKLCPLQFTDGASLKIQWADKCVRFLYVPLPLFTASLVALSLARW
jgi:hypothetical protein